MIAVGEFFSDTELPGDRHDGRGSAFAKLDASLLGLDDSVIAANVSLSCSLFQTRAGRHSALSVEFSALLGHVDQAPRRYPES